MKKSIFVLSAIIFLSSVSFVQGRPIFVGFSGAPGSNGTCASSCHGSSDGSIQVSGLPEKYIPGQIYTITISHDGGNSIKQFNGSCRIGDSPQNAGTISAGLNTATYSISEETNGIHLASLDLDSATFYWEAPLEGVGEVRLYIAGHQGSRPGPNTAIVVSLLEQATEIRDEISTQPIAFDLLHNYPNPFNASTTVEFSIPEPQVVKLKIYNLLGREVKTLVDEYKQAGIYSITFDASDLSSGVYFYRVEAADFAKTRKMILLK